VNRGAGPREAVANRRRGHGEGEVTDAECVTDPVLDQKRAAQKFVAGSRINLKSSPKDQTRRRTFCGVDAIEVGKSDPLGDRGEAILCRNERCGSKERRAQLVKSKRIVADRILDVR
jgi:hypothetical protein